MAEAETIRLRGNDAFKRGNYLDAIRLFTESLAINATIEAYSNRAQAHIEMRNYNLAIDDSLEALKLNPDHLKSRYRFAVALTRSGKFMLAIRQICLCLDLLQTGEESPALTNLFLECLRACERVDDQQLLTHALRTFRQHGASFAVDNWRLVIEGADPPRIQLLTGGFLGGDRTADSLEAMRMLMTEEMDLDAKMTKRMAAMRQLDFDKPGFLDELIHCFRALQSSKGLLDRMNIQFLGNRNCNSASKLAQLFASFQRPLTVWIAKMEQSTLDATIFLTMPAILDAKLLVLSCYTEFWQYDRKDFLRPIANGLRMEVDGMAELLHTRINFDYGERPSQSDFMNFQLTRAVISDENADKLALKLPGRMVIVDWNSFYSNGNGQESALNILLRQCVERFLRSQSPIFYMLRVQFPKGKVPSAIRDLLNKDWHNPNTGELLNMKLTPASAKHVGYDGKRNVPRLDMEILFITRMLLIE